MKTLAIISMALLTNTATGAINDLVIALNTELRQISTAYVATVEDSWIILRYRAGLVNITDSKAVTPYTTSSQVQEATEDDGLLLYIRSTSAFSPPTAMGITTNHIHGRIQITEAWIMANDNLDYTITMITGQDVTENTKSAIRKAVRHAFQHVLAVDGRPEAGLRPLVAERYVKTRH